MKDKESNLASFRKYFKLFHRKGAKITKKKQKFFFALPSRSLRLCGFF